MCEHADDIKVIRETLIRQDEKLGRIDDHLKTLNGSVAKNQNRIEELEKNDQQIFHVQGDYLQTFQKVESKMDDLMRSRFVQYGWVLVGFLLGLFAVVLQRIGILDLLG